MKMRFVQHYSGSAGNLYEVVIDAGKRLLIDPGVSWMRIQEALDYDLSDIVGCLLTHEHKDHSKAVQDVMQAGIKVFASAGTFEALGIKEGRRAKIVKDKSIIRFNPGFKVRAFAAHHDCAEPLGFLIRDTSDYLFFATDTAYISQRFAIAFDIIAIECSYDIEILKKQVESQEINETVAKRLLDSHLEKRQTMRYLDEFCDLGKCRELHLLHTSDNTLDRVRVQKEFESKYFIKTIVKDGNIPGITNN